MSFTDAVLKPLGDTAFATAILESGWLFPTIETVHVLALALVFGSIVFVDLRLLGIASRDRTVGSLARDVLPWTWAGFGLALVSGALMFASQPVKYFDNLPFRIKFLFLALIGLNMAFFQWRTYPRVAALGSGAALPVAARLAGAFSLLLWVSVVASGRWIAFTGH